MQRAHIFTGPRSPMGGGGTTLRVNPLPPMPLGGLWALRQRSAVCLAPLPLDHIEGEAQTDQCKERPTSCHVVNSFLISASLVQQSRADGSWRRLAREGQRGQARGSGHLRVELVQHPKVPAPQPRPARRQWVQADEVCKVLPAVHRGQTEAR